MRIAESKGILLVTMAVDQREVPCLQNLSPAELASRARAGLEGLISMDLIKDLLVELDQEEMKVAIRI